jgi:hypothetical protein
MSTHEYDNLQDIKITVTMPRKKIVQYTLTMKDDE